MVAEASLLLLLWLFLWVNARGALKSGVLLGVVLAAGIVVAGLGLVVFISVVVPRRMRVKPGVPPGIGIPGLTPTAIFWISVSYLVLLITAAVIYNVMDKLQRPDLQFIGGILPIGVPWYGALGAVTISLYGVFRHNDEWLNKYNYWHVARPLVGAILGTVAFLIFFGLIQATTEEQAATGAMPAPLQGISAQGLIIYYILAFIVGYREETFRDLIKRATDILFRPGGVPPEGVIDVYPGAPIMYGRVAAGEHSEPIDVRVTNRSEANVDIGAKNVQFSGSHAKHWEVLPGPGNDPRAWYSEGSLSTIPPSTSLWIRTRWNPIIGESVPGTVEYAHLSISYSGVEGPPKSLLVTGEVLPPKPMEPEAPGAPTPAAPGAPPPGALEEAEGEEEQGTPK